MLFFYVIKFYTNKKIQHNRAWNIIKICGLPQVHTSKMQICQIICHHIHVDIVVHKFSNLNKTHSTWLLSQLDKHQICQDQYICWLFDHKQIKLHVFTTLVNSLFNNDKFGNAVPKVHFVMTQTRSKSLDVNQ